MDDSAPNTGPHPSLVSGIAGCLVAILVGELAIIAVGLYPAPQGYWSGVLTSFPLTLGLLYGDSRLAQSDLSPARNGRINWWTLGGLFGFVLLNVAIIVAMGRTGPLLVVSWLRWAATIGASIGLLAGAFEAKAIDRELAAERVRLREAELERQNDRLEKFASVVSHDLRNPMNVALGHLSIARRDGKAKHLDAVETALERMDRIVDDTLTLAREGRVVGETAAVDLDAVARECWAAVDTEGATLTVTGEMTVQADRSRLRHVFENLFRNAIEHGTTPADAAEPAEGPLSVTVGPLEDGSGFYVADDGPGIPEGEREQVFEMGRTSTESGTGFGLAIVQQIVTANGWAVEVTESAAGGARFEITDVGVEERTSALARAR